MPSSSALGEVALAALIISAMLGPIALVGVGRADALLADRGTDSGGNLEANAWDGWSTKVGVAGVLRPAFTAGSDTKIFG